MRFQKYFLIFVVMIFLFIGCGENYQYKKAEKTNTIEGYENFIRKYPESKYLAEINDSLRVLYYKKAKEVNTIEEYENFLEKYPEGDYVSVIKENLLDLRYQEVKSVGTKDAYRKFLERYPNTKYSKEINILLNPYPIYLSWVKPVTKPTTVDDLPDIYYGKKAGTKINKVSWRFKFWVSNEGEIQEWAAEGKKLIKIPSESGIITGENGNWKYITNALLSYNFYRGERSTIEFALFNTSGKRQLSNWLEATILID